MLQSQKGGFTLKPKDLDPLPVDCLAGNAGKGPSPVKLPANGLKTVHEICDRVRLPFAVSIFGMRPNQRGQRRSATRDLPRSTAILAASGRSLRTETSGSLCIFSRQTHGQLKRWQRPKLCDEGDLAGRGEIIEATPLILLLFTPTPTSKATARKGRE